MNVLIVSDIFFSEEPGGSSRIVWEIGRRFVAMGHRVQVLAGGKPGLKIEETFEGIRVLRYARSRWNFFRDYHAVEEASRSITDPIDVIYILHPFSGIAIQRIQRFARVPMIYFFNSSWSLEYLIRRSFGRTPMPWHRWIANRFDALERRALLHSDRVLTISKYITDLLLSRHPVDPGKIVPISLGADVQRFAPHVTVSEARKRLQWTEGKTHLLSVRNLEPRMGLENLIDAMADLREKEESLHLTIIGNGSLRSFLQNHASERGVDGHVTFLGEVSDEVLSLAYQAADLFVLPTRELEGFGLVTVEAMASGCPVVATPVGATPEILGGFDAGLLAKDAGAKEIGAAIARFLARRSEWPELRKRAARYARENYSWETVVRRINKVAEGLLNPVKR